MANVQNSGKREMRAGPHQVRLVFADGDTIGHAVEVKSSERVTYDFSKGTVTRRPETRP